MSLIHGRERDNWYKEMCQLICILILLTLSKLQSMIFITYRVYRILSNFGNNDYDINYFGLSIYYLFLKIVFLRTIQISFFK